jgi:hypothetical protein
MQAELAYKQAVSRQSWHRDSIRTLMVTLIDQYPGENDDGLIRRAIDKMREDEEWLVAAGEYAAMQTLSTIHRRKEMAIDPVARQEHRAEQQAQIEKIKDQIMLLNLEMPNGKRLRYCTREDLAGFNKGYDRLVKKMKPLQMVGQAFNEDQVRAIMSERKKS